MARKSKTKIPAKEMAAKESSMSKMARMKKEMIGDFKVADVEFSMRRKNPRTEGGPAVSV